MGFPNVIYGDVGDEKVAQSTKIGSLPLGTPMRIADGNKESVLTRAATSAALIAGVVVGGQAETAGHGNVSGSGLLTSATTTENLAGATDVYLISQSAAVLLNHFADGQLQILGPAGSSAYAGRVYAVKSNESAAVSSRFKVTLKVGDSLASDLKPGSTLTSLRRNKYASAVVWAAGQPILGVTSAAVSAGFYFWAQTKGDASCWQSATVATDGAPVMADTAVAGSVTVASSGAASTNIWATQGVIGVARGAAAASQAVIVDLNI